MPSFSYTARDNFGAAASGSMVADSIEHVQQLLRVEGKYPITISPGGDSDFMLDDEAANIKIARVDLIQFAQQLSIMIETGVVLSEALDCISAQAEKPNVKRLVEDLSHSVQQGKDFSWALGRHPRSFPRMFISLIQASEKSGMLAKLLGRATGYLRDEQETLRRVKGAVTYPGIMLTFAITTTIFLLIFVLPRFTSIYAAKKAALPIPTKMLMAMSDFVITQWPWLVGGGLLAGGLGYLFLGTVTGKRAWHNLQIHLPIMGRVFRKLHLSRGLRMVGTLFGAGVSLVDCVTTAEHLAGNVYYKELWAKVSEDIQAGLPVSTPMFSNNLVPRSVAQMLSSAEKTGKLGIVMEQIAGFAEVELKEQITELTRYIEPAMIVLMGIIIGGVAMALLLPIFTISKVMAS